MTACAGGNDAGGGALLNGSQSTAAESSPATGGEPTAPPDTLPANDTPPVNDTLPAGDTSPPVEETFPTVETRVVGAAVGGSSGDEGPGSTDPLSETVRNADGTCSGWEGPGGTWTQGLESGAPVVFLDRDSDTQIGAGTLGTSAWNDADPEGGGQWNCTFPFTGTVEGAPDSFRVKVGQLEPWLAVPDPTAAGAFVASVNSVATTQYFTSCTEPDPSLTEVFDWSSVGQYWSDGVQSLCANGLVVADIERPCRPAGFGSDRVLKVTSAIDPAWVLEDAGGLHIVPEAIPVRTEVIVHIATGRPCG